MYHPIYTTMNKPLKYCRIRQSERVDNVDMNHGIKKINRLFDVRV